jgi:tetratricopeptide (TPR) repeat protein
MSEAKDTFEVRVSRLSHYITRAYKYKKPSILFAMYMSEFLRADAEKSLEKSLKEQGLKIVDVDAGKKKDIPYFISSINSNNNVFLVHDMEKGFPEALHFLNFKREELIEHNVKVVFWVREEELARISEEAPDFFAFRNRVVEFMEVPVAEEHRLALIEFAAETEYKSLDEIKRSIELKETLLAELSNETEISKYLLGSLGILYYKIGFYRKSIEYSEKALKIAQKIGDRRNESLLFRSLGAAYHSIGEIRNSIRYYEKALKFAHEIGDRKGESVSLGSLGNIYAILGEAKKSKEYHDKALKIAQEIGDKEGESTWLRNTGSTYVLLGEVKKAIEYFEKSLKIDREIGNRRGEGSSLGNLGTVYNDLGDTRKAIDYYENALKIAQEIEDHRAEGTWLNNVGSTFKNEKKYNEALACYLLAKDIHTQIESPDLKTTESNLEKLKEKLGKKEFEKLEAEVAPRAAEIVKKILEGTSV